MTTETKPVHQITDLPFVRNATRQEQRDGREPRIFWSVEPTGNYSADCETGARYAGMALDYMAREGFSPLLAWAVCDMMTLGRQHSGIEIGFLSEFGHKAAVCQQLIHMHREGSIAA